MKRKTVFISTAIPYVNAAPHLGFALESIQADALARYYRARGHEVFFLTGTDENALKNVIAAEGKGMDVRAFVDMNAARFKELRGALDLSWNDFIRTTEPRHVKGAQKFWNSCRKEDIYKKYYEGFYCLGCEEFKLPKDLTDDRCIEHPNQKLQHIKEENYFFRLSSYQKELEEILASDRLKVLWSNRKNEVTSFINQGLEDFSISRSVERAKGWGIPVPNDSSQIQFVWFDALTNYITALGYAEHTEQFKKYWEEGDEMIHLIGKGVSRFHAVYWPAMLLSAGVRIPTKVLIHGYVTVDGKKISKSLGNVVDPFELIGKYGTDVVRYHLLRDIVSGEDGDFSYERLETRYNADLANGLGNFASRVTTLAEKYGPFEETAVVTRQFEKVISETHADVKEQIESFRLHEALKSIWELISIGDAYVNARKPWENGDKQVLFDLMVLLDNVAAMLQPFMPATAENITSAIRHEDGKIQVRKIEILFPRLEK